MTSMKGLCIVLLVFFVLVALAISASVENDGFDEVQREDASSDVYNDPYGDGYGGNRVADMAKMAADYEDPYGYGGPGYGGPGAAPPVSTATELTSLEDIDSFIQVGLVLLVMFYILECA